MKTENHIGLFVFRHDLRLDDMPALQALSECVTSLICLYVATPYSAVVSTGECRRQFALQSLTALNSSLNDLGQYLVFEEGNWLSIVSRYIEENGVTHVGCAEYHGYNERQDLLQLQSRFGHVNFATHSAHSLFTEASLPFSTTDMPSQFTPFRKVIEKTIEPSVAKERTVSLPPPLSSADNTLMPLKAICERAVSYQFFGGEKAALQHVNTYFSNPDLPTTYKQTRNQLDGWEFSSKCSAWLANGSLSARRLYQTIKRFEADHTANESTYWLYFELLWREFFYWQQIKHGPQWFALSGVKQNQGVSQGTAHFTTWSQGNTDAPIVNALMRQLVATGYMSNRGRQIAASYLVNQLAQDWRLGARFFEQHLIDYDVASNYGNWQYLAGVGADPRGKREFNIDKQTKQFDPDNIFIRSWLP